MIPLFLRETHGLQVIETVINNFVRAGWCLSREQAVGKEAPAAHYFLKAHSLSIVKAARQGEHDFDEMPRMNWTLLESGN